MDNLNLFMEVKGQFYVDISILRFPS